MNPWQVARQIRYRLAARTWPNAGGLTVFGVVVVVPGDFSGLFANFRSPSCGIKISSASIDPENKRLIAQTFEVVVAVALHGDPVGQAAVIGHGRTGGQVASQGRGLLEVEEELKSVLHQMTDQDGIRILLSSSADAGLVEGKDVMPFACARSYSIEAHCTTERYYHPPRNLVATNAGGGQASLTWSLPPDRFDRRQIVLRRASGATAPASATAGTGVALSGNLVTSVTDSPGAGTWSYAVFCGYDETTSGTNERYSEQETGTTRTVAVT